MFPCSKSSALRPYAASLSILILSIFAGCPSNHNGGSTVTSIGPSGGTVQNDAGARIAIPAGALNSEVSIQIVQDPLDAPAMGATLSAYGAVFALLPHGITFSTPVTVSIPFDPEMVPTGAVPKLYKAEPGGSFVEIPASIVGDTLEAQISTFSFVQALGNPLVESLPAKEIVVTFDYGVSGQCSTPAPCGVGNLQWTVPSDVYSATFELYGASGGGLQGAGKGRGLGGKTTATLDVYPGEVLDIALGAPGNTLAASGGGGAGGHGGLWTLFGSADHFFSQGSAGGGETDVVRGERGVPNGWSGAHGRILVAGGGGGDAGVTVKHVDSDGTFGNLTSSNSWAINAPGAAGGLGGGLVAGTGGSGQGGVVTTVYETGESSSESYSAASGGTGGSTLAPGQAGASSLLSPYDPPKPSSPAADGSLLLGGGHGGDGATGAGGVGGGGGGGGWMPGGGGGSSWSPYLDAAGGGGGSSFGPDGSTFFQGVNSGGGKVIITFTPSPGRLPTTTTVTSSGTPSSAGQAVTFTATVTLKPPAVGPVTGSVRFEIDGVLLGDGPVTLVDGHATSDVAKMLAPGLNSVVVIYLGSGNVAPSNATLSQAVIP